MNEDLEDLVQRLRDCEHGDCNPIEEEVEESGLSDGQLCYVSLAANNSALLPEWADDSEIPAFFRLPPHWRAAVCRWRGWPEEWAAPLPSEQEVGQWERFRNGRYG
jgi:hypothetical protein